MSDLEELLERLANRNPSLTRVSIPPPPSGDHDGDSDDDDIDVYPLLAKHLAGNRIVTALSIQDRGPADDEGVATLSRALPTMTALSSLALGGVGLAPGDVDELASALPSIPALAFLDLRGNGIDDGGAEALVAALGACPELTSLDLGENKIGDEGAKALATVLPDLSGRLVSLSLGVLIGKEGTRALGKVLPSLGCLTSLDLSFNKKNGIDLANVVAVSLPYLSALQCLKLRSTGIGPRGAKALLAALRKSSSLQELDLNDCRLGFFGAKAIGGGLPSSLTSLDIGRNGIGEDGTWQFASVLTSLDKLSHFSIASNAIGDDGASEIGRYLPSLVGLCSLDMSDNKFGDAGVEVLADAFLSLPKLNKLNLSQNSISDAGAAALGRALEGAPPLRELDIRSNRIGDDGAKALAEGVKDNTTLSEMLLSANEIGDEGAGFFVEHLDQNLTLLKLELSGNKVSSSRLRILEMLLKHRKPPAPPSTPERSKGIAPAIESAETDSPEVQRQLEFDKVEQSRCILQNVLDENIAPVVEVSSQYVECVTDGFNVRSIMSYGAFGDLHEGVDATLNRKFAIRRIHLGEAGVMKEMRRRVFDELTSLKLINHSNILPLRAFSVNTTGTCYSMLYDLASTNTLNELIADEDKRKQMPWPVRLHIMRGIVGAIEFLHTGGSGQKMVRLRRSFHGDIKSENVFLDDQYSVRLIDCGISRLVVTDRSLFEKGDVVFGTRGYRCPRYERGFKYTTECDVFSLGIVMSELIAGKLQNHINDKTERVQDFYYDYILEKRISIDPLAGAVDGKVTAGLCKLSLACMHSEPSKRPTSPALSKLLQDIHACAG